MEVFEIDSFTETELKIQKEGPLIRRVIALSWFTICYNVIEGVVSMGFGFSEHSVALFGFGADSFIEVASATLVLWRFRGESGLGNLLETNRERSATLGIGILFLLLALGAVMGGAFQLFERSHPKTTLPGLVISALSLSFMFFLWHAKRSVGQSLNSSTVINDAACSFACIQLSVVLFLGSLLFMMMPDLWWADSVAAIILAGFIAKEGLKTVRAARAPEFLGGCDCSGD